MCPREAQTYDLPFLSPQLTILKGKKTAVKDEGQGCPLSFKL